MQKHSFTYQSKNEINKKRVRKNKKKVGNKKNNNDRSIFSINNKKLKRIHKSKTKKIKLCILSEKRPIDIFFWCQNIVSNKNKVEVEVDVEGEVEGEVKGEVKVEVKVDDDYEDEIKDEHDLGIIRQIIINKIIKDKRHECKISFLQEKYKRGNFFMDWVVFEKCILPYVPEIKVLWNDLRNWEIISTSRCINYKNHSLHMEMLSNRTIRPSYKSKIIWNEEDDDFYDSSFWDFL